MTAKLVEHFPKIMDIRFTSHVEGELDKIEEAHLDWHHVLHEFYDPFKESLAKAHEEMEKVRAEPSEYTCDQCGKDMVYRLSKNGRFLSCSGYPECKNAKNIDKDGKPKPQKGAKLAKKKKPTRMEAEYIPDNAPESAGPPGTSLDTASQPASPKKKGWF